MNDAAKSHAFFLLDQKLSHLVGAKTVDEREAMVCGSGFGIAREEKRQATWEPTSRPDVLAWKSNKVSPLRVGLVCIAGRGKTTNMGWLRATMMADPHCRQLPVLLRLDDFGDANLLFDAIADAASLFDWLAQDINRKTASTVDRARHRHHLARLQAEGRITLLIDGLDHLSPPPKDTVAGVLKDLFESSWRNCPIWISGRPEAFKQSWELFDGPQWRFLNVEPLAERELLFYLNQVVEPDLKPRVPTSDWFGDKERQLLKVESPAQEEIVNSLTRIIARERVNPTPKRDWFSGDEWQFLRGDPLTEAKIVEHFCRVGEGELKPLTPKRDWIDAIADEGQNLLATPRFLYHIAQVVRGAVTAARSKNEDPRLAVAALDLRTKADVYRLAYLEPGRFIKDKVAELDRAANLRGLIAQGVDVHTVDKHTKTVKYPILPPGERLNEQNYESVVSGIAALLGAIAFEMYANPQSNRPGGEESDTAELDSRPNTSGVPFKLLPLFYAKVAKRLKPPNESPNSDIDAAAELLGMWFNNVVIASEADLLGMMNAGHVNFLFFRDLAHQGLLWHDKTVQAFFAAYWAMRYGSEDDLKTIQTWIWHGEYDEFWQFCAEMPAAALQTADVLRRSDLRRWRATFDRYYLCAEEIRRKASKQSLSRVAAHEWLQWHRRMIYYSLKRMKIWGRDQEGDIVAEWRRPFEELRTTDDPERMRIYQKIAGVVEDKYGNKRSVFREIPSGDCAFGAAPDGEPGSPGVLRRVEEFRLHQWTVTNEMYEIFDVGHRAERWADEHPLAAAYWKRKDQKKDVVIVTWYDAWGFQKKDARNPEDRCPVVNVTWYDAWCFATWCGCRLPTELEWEHSCRCGRATAFTFGDNHSICESENCNCSERLNYRTEEIIGKSTIPVEEFEPNPWGLWQMHGNVWEWCDSRYKRGASHRVLRGGSWYDGAGDCQSASRDRYEPGGRNVVVGFRLAGPVGAKRD